MPQRPSRDSRSVVLTAHRVVPELEHPHDTLESSFEALLSDLATAPSSPHLTQAPGTYALTFDDGTADHLWVAQRLAARGLQGLFYVTTNAIDTPGFLTWDQVRQLVKWGQVIGSHSADHISPRNLTQEQTLAQLTSSRQRLQDELEVEVQHYAPPFGYTTPQLPDLVRQAGYQTCRLTRWGVTGPGSDPGGLPSIPITEFTLSRSWPQQAVRSARVPRSMRTMQLGRAILPETARGWARTALKHLGDRARDKEGAQ